MIVWSLMFPIFFRYDFVLFFTVAKIVFTIPDTVTRITPRTSRHRGWSAWLAEFFSRTRQSCRTTQSAHTPKGRRTQIEFSASSARLHFAGHKGSNFEPLTLSVRKTNSYLYIIHCKFCLTTFCRAQRSLYVVCALKDTIRFVLLCAEIKLIRKLNFSVQIIFYRSQAKFIKGNIYLNLKFSKFYTFTRYLKHANSVHKLEISRDWFHCSVCDTFHPSPEALRSHSNAGLKFNSSSWNTAVKLLRRHSAIPKIINN